jgi:hypothetical protein
MTTMKIGSFWRERPGRRKATTFSTKGMNRERHGLNSSCAQERNPIPGPIPRHAQLEDLQRLGFKIVNPDPNGCCVRRNGRTFLEGHLESMAAEVRDNAHEAIGKDRPWGNSRDAAQTKGILAEVGIVTSNTHCWLSSECADEGGEAQT